MESVQIKEYTDGAAVFIDGAEITGVTYVKIEKSGGEPTTIEIRGRIFSAAQAETE